MSLYEIRNTDVHDGLAAMPERSVHCCVTSPPYWGLRDYGVAGQIGQEATPQEFVATLVRVFAGVWRVLRDDGVLFVNLGDSYCNTDKWGGGGKNTGKHSTDGDDVPSWAVRAKKQSVAGLKPKDRCLVPERFVLAMQEAGWYVRDVICWHKANPMPVSVRDRCTPAWEPIYMFTKRPRYFWDAEAVKVASPTAGKPIKMADGWDTGEGSHGTIHRNGREQGAYTGVVQPVTANPRNVWATPLDTLSRFELESLVREMAGDDMPDLWCISSEPLKSKHYAAFPSKLPTMCIKAATSELGVCSACLAPWVRIVERVAVSRERPNDLTKRHLDDGTGNACPNTVAGVASRTVDWKPSCDCNTGTIPATVLDPFSGAGTTCLAATRLGRRSIGLELSAEYCRLSRERIESELAESEAEIEPTPAMLFDIAEQCELFAEMAKR